MNDAITALRQHIVIIPPSVTLRVGVLSHWRCQYITPYVGEHIGTDKEECRIIMVTSGGISLAPSRLVAIILRLTYVSALLLPCVALLVAKTGRVYFVISTLPFGGMMAFENTMFGH